VVELVVATTGSALSPPVAGWFVVPGDWALSDGTETVLLGTGSELAGTVEGSVGVDCAACGELVAPISWSLGSSTPDSALSVEDMAVDAPTADGNWLRPLIWGKGVTVNGDGSQGEKGVTREESIGPDVTSQLPGGTESFH